MPGTPRRHENMSLPAVTCALALVLYGLGLGVEYLATHRLDRGPDAPAYRLIAGWAVMSLAAVVVALTGAHLTIPALFVCAIGTCGLVLLRLNGSGVVY